MTDDITGIFDDLEPHQFHFTGSSLIDEENEPCTFGSFIESHKLILRAQFAAAGGQPNPVVFLGQPGSMPAAQEIADNPLDHVVKRHKRSDQPIALLDSVRAE